MKKKKRELSFQYLHTFLKKLLLLLLFFMTPSKKAQIYIDFWIPKSSTCDEGKLCDYARESVIETNLKWHNIRLKM